MVTITLVLRDVFATVVDVATTTHILKLPLQLMLQKLVKLRFAHTMVFRRSIVPNAINHNGDLVTKPTLTLNSAIHVPLELTF